MAHRLALEALERTLRDFRGSEQQMGDDLILLAGDFRQPLPIIPRGTVADELKARLKSSALWKHVIYKHRVQKKCVTSFTRRSYCCSFRC
jgi:hypothetical protein